MGKTILGLLILIICGIIYLVKKIKKVLIEKRKNNNTANNIFYMGLPTKDGFMDKDKKIIYAKDESVFKFTVDPNRKDVAFYEVIMGEDILDIFRKNINDIYLKNVCRFLETTTQYATSFTTLKSGCAKYVNKKWEILYPIEIQLESKKEAREPKLPPQSPPIRIEQSSKFYMGIPDKNIFPDYARSSVYKKGISMFEFSEGINNQARFKMISDDETVKYSIKNYLNLHSACFMQNLPNLYTKTIETFKYGFATFDGVNWRIDKRAEIRFSDIIQPVNITQKTHPITNVEPIKPEMKQAKFYMAMPDGNIFHDYAKSSVYKSGLSKFEFREVRKNVAEFKMMSDDETLKFVKNRAIDNLKAVCSLSNLPSRGTIEILTTKPGLATFDGSSWLIEKRAEIKFIETISVVNSVENLSQFNPATEKKSTEIPLVNTQAPDAMQPKPEVPQKPIPSNPQIASTSPPILSEIIVSSAIFPKKQENQNMAKDIELILGSIQDKGHKKGGIQLLVEKLEKNK